MPKWSSTYQPRRRRGPRWDVQLAVRLVQQDMSYTDIGAVVGVCGSAVVQYFRRHPTLPRSQKGRGPNAPRKALRVTRRRCWNCQQIFLSPHCPCGRDL